MLRVLTLILLAFPLSLPAFARHTAPGMPCPWFLSPGPLDLKDSRFADYHKMAAEVGFTAIIPPLFFAADGKVRQPSPAERRDLEELYGAKIIIFSPDAAPAETRHIPGLVLHLVDGAFDKYQGDLNVFEKNPALEKYVNDKGAEYEIGGPQFMPETRSALSVIGASWPNAPVRKVLVGALDRYVSSSARRVPPSTRYLLIQLLARFLRDADLAFAPDGSFIKYIHENQTGDRGQTIHTPEADPVRLADGFITELERAKAATPTARVFSDAELLRSMNSTEMSAAHLVRGLLLNPKEIIVQRKLKLLHTRSGEIAEVRIDFAPRGDVNASLRWGYDVPIDYIRRAVGFFRRLLKQMPAGFSGGADIGFTQDGRLKIFEFNFGSDSGYMAPPAAIVEGNLFISKIIGRPTPLIAKLESLVSASVENQARYLMTTQLVAYSKAPMLTIRDIPLSEAFKYFRDRMIEGWLIHPSESGAQDINSHLRQLANLLRPKIANQELNSDLNDIIRYGADYMADKTTGKEDARVLQPAAEAGF